MGLRRAIVSRLGRDILREVADQAAARAVEEALAEAHAGAGIDPDEHLWRSLTKNVKRNLDPISHERALEVVWTLYQQNPLANRITKMTRDFVVGDGITWSARNPEVEEIVGNWWSDDVNDLDHRVHDFALELGLWGELAIEAHVGPVSGIFELGYIDPSQIAKVSHVKGNPLVLDKVVLKGDSGGTEGKSLDVVRAREGGAFEGEVFFFRANTVSNSTRGWPDLLHIADWLDAYDQLLWEMLERARLVRIFIWDVTLRGMDQAQIDAWSRVRGTTPRSGSVRAHNDSETWEAVAPTLGSFETAQEAEVLLEHISAGAGLPKHWLASAEDVNRATALEMGAPTVRTLGQRQRYFVDVVLRRMARFALAKAEAAGKLRTEDGMVQVHDEDGKLLERDGERVMARPHELVVFQAPEISPRDFQKAADVLVKVAQMLAIAETQQWFGTQTIRQVLAVALAHIGFDYNPEPEEDADAIPKETEKEPGSRKDMERAVADLELGALKERVTAAGVLIRSGFEPKDALRAVGLDPIKHSGLLPVTVRSEAEVPG